MNNNLQARGIILEKRFRDNFPGPPEDFPIDSPERTDFEDNHTTPNSPLSVVFCVIAPNLPDPDARNGAPFRAYISIPEEATLEDFVPGIFTGMVIEFAHIYGKPWSRQAAFHSHVDHTSVLLITQRGRFLKIPWATRVGDLWAGIRGPLTNSCPFEDLRPTPRPRPHEVDGASFNLGFSVDILILDNEEVGPL